MNGVDGDARGDTSAGADGASAPAQCDVLVVGGGINGAGVARDLSGRGFRVVLCEQDDLAGHTSSSSTKLIHGGLRYLEHREFGLVRKALAEREVLLRSAPHLMRPLRFVMPHDPAMRPAWMIRVGLFLYDHLAHRALLPGSRAVRLGASHPAGATLKAQFTRGFEYSDVWVDDARLVVANAMDAAARGATIVTRCAVVAAAAGDGAWQVQVRHADGRTQRLRARALVNAAGPWADRFLRSAVGARDVRPLRLVKGSHIVVSKLFDHPYPYFFQNPDGRILFAIPYETSFTLIGTTDVDTRGADGAPALDDDELHYLCAAASRWFARPVVPADVVWHYSGVRPLLDDEHGNPAAVTRDYRLALDAEGAPLLTVWGGKLTTYRRLAEEASDRLVAALGPPHAGAAGPWTAHAALPGGDLGGWIETTGDPVRDFETFERALGRALPDVAPPVRHRLARCYGARVSLLLDGGTLGREIVPGVHEHELEHLRTHEWAHTLDDVLWRRTKLGLHLTAQQVAVLRSWWSMRDGAPADGGTHPVHMDGRT